MENLESVRKLKKQLELTISLNIALAIVFVVSGVLMDDRGNFLWAAFSVAMVFIGLGTYKSVAKEESALMEEQIQKTSGN